jgi:hypothetical protein
LIARFTQLIEERHNVEKPDCMLFVSIFKVKIRIVARRLDFRAPNFSVVGTAHRFGKADQLRFFSADRPIVSVTAERDDPLFVVGIFQ